MQRTVSSASGHAGTSSTFAAGPSTTASSPQQQAELFRALTWDATVSLCIGLSADELPAGSDRSIDTLHVSSRLKQSQFLVGPDSVAILS